MSIRSFMVKMVGLLSLGAVPAAAQGVASTVQLTVTTPLTIYYGQNVDGYANVASGDGNPLAGTITFYDGATNICVISVTNAATCPTTTGTGFAAGTHVLTAAYSGDSTHASSTSNAVTVTVLPDITSVSVASSVNPATFGQSVVFTAMAQGAHGAIAGTVVFLDGSTAIGSAVLNSSGVASMPTSTLAVGTHPITAMYGATQNFVASTSAALNEVVQPAPTPNATTTMLASSANPSVSGQSVTYTVSVAAAGQAKTPTGLVSVLDGSSTLWAGMLDGNGSASFSTALGTGTHSLTAHYGGDATMAGSSSAAMAQVVTAAQSGTGSFTIEAGPVTVAPGKMASVTVKVIPVGGFNQAVQLGCSDLPSESACTFGTGMIRAGGGSTTLQLSTMSPHDCGSATPYSAGLPLAGPAAAGLLMLFLPGRRRCSLRGVLVALVALSGLAMMTGCGNCTDLGTKPGTYTFNITGTALGSVPTVVSHKVTLKVTF